MNNIEILKMCDHTVLRTDASLEEIKKNCNLAINYNCASICIAPCHVEAASKLFGDKLPICTVIGFPNGYNDTETKVFEAKHMINCGATEIDMVINIGLAVNEKYEELESEIKAVREATKGYTLKVIVETCKLPENVLRRVCKCVSMAGADFIKTSTGFDKRGATVQDIKIMRKECDPKTKIKAAGGISSFEDAEELIKAGATRLGTSRLVKLMEKI